MNQTIQHKDVYVFVEQRDGKIQNVGLELLGKARDLADTLQQKVVALWLGRNIEPQCQQLVAAGADRVVCMDHPVLEHYITEPYTQAIAHAVHQFHPLILLMGATTIGRDLGPRLSARLNT